MLQLTIRVHLVLRLRMTGTVPLLPIRLCVVVLGSAHDNFAVALRKPVFALSQSVECRAVQIIKLSDIKYARKVYWRGNKSIYVQTLFCLLYITTCFDYFRSSSGSQSVFKTYWGYDIWYNKIWYMVWYNMMWWYMICDMIWYIC
jgi:hypothetical protein